MANERPEGRQLEALRNPGSVRLVLTTLYPQYDPLHPERVDTLRGDLALRTCQAAQQDGFSLDVLDGGSNAAFLEAMRRAGISILVHADATRAERKRFLYQHASGDKNVKVVFSVEPEKRFSAEAIALAAEPILRGEADVVIPARDAAAWATYPEYQVRSEQHANKQYNDILRARGLLKSGDPDLDHFFGPRAIANTPAMTALMTEQYEAMPLRHDRRDPLEQLSSLESYLNATYLPIVRALQEGLRVKSVTVPFHYPPEQCAAESGSATFDRKRDRQRRDIVTGLIELLKDSSRSRLKRR